MRGNSQADRTAKLVCGVGSIHIRPITLGLGFQPASRMGITWVKWTPVYPPPLNWVHIHTQCLFSGNIIVAGTPTCHFLTFCPRLHLGAISVMANRQGTSDPLVKFVGVGEYYCIRTQEIY